MIDILISVTLILLLTLVAIGAVEGGIALRRRYIRWQIQRIQREQTERQGAAMTTHTCEEETIRVFRGRPVRCGKTAVMLIQPRHGRRHEPYWTCYPHASHNIINRDAEDVTPADMK